MTLFDQPNMKLTFAHNLCSMFDFTNSINSVYYNLEDFMLQPNKYYKLSYMYLVIFFHEI